MELTIYALKSYKRGLGTLIFVLESLSTLLLLKLRLAHSALYLFLF